MSEGAVVTVRTATLRYFTSDAWRRRLRRWEAIATVFALAHLSLVVGLVSDPPVVPDTPFALRALMLFREWGAIGIMALLTAWTSTRLIRVPLLLVAAAILGFGWMGYVGSSRFPNLEAIALFFMTPELLVAHLRDLDTRLLPIVLGGMVLVVVLTEHHLSRTLRRASETRSRVVAAGWIILAPATWLLSVRDAARLGAIYDAHTGVEFAYQDYRRDLLETVSGPFTTLVGSSLRRARASGGENLSPSWPSESAPRGSGPPTVLGEPAHRWNVLVVTVESMRDDILDSTGAAAIMPTVAGITASSRRYVDTYATATQTNLAAVVPLSGTWPLRQNRVAAYPTFMAYPKVLLYDVLGPLGWRTGVFSSQNEGWWGMRRFLASPRLDTLHDAEAAGSATFIPANDLGFARFAADERHAGKLDDAETIAHAVRWLAQDTTRPFFLSLNLQASHVPYSSPGMERGDDQHQRPSFRIFFGRYPIDSTPAVVAQYHRALRYIDTQLAILQNALIASGRWDSTLVVITGDHGQAFFEHGVAAHANGLWQEQVRVPLVIQAPTLARGTDLTPASHIDVAPTVLSLLGLPAQPAWQGQSLTEPDRREAARFFVVQSPLAHAVGAVAGGWKVVRNLESGEVRVTNLTTDPGERHLAAVEAHPAARILLRQLDGWRAMQLEYYGSARLMTTRYPPRLTRDTAAGSATTPRVPARSP